MKRFTIITFLFLAVANTDAYAKDNKCADLSAKLSKYWNRPVPCYCGAALSNLEITPPRGLRVEAVCGLRDETGRWIDLEKEKASLDHFKNGNLPDGEVYLSGQITLTGSAGMEPSNSGTLAFGSECDMQKEPVFQKKFFCEFKLGSDADYKKLGGPKPYNDKEFKCWRMNVTIKVIDPVVSLGDTDSAGTYPRNIVVLKKTMPVFYTCYQ